MMPRSKQLGTQNSKITDFKKQQLGTRKKLFEWSSKSEFYNAARVPELEFQSAHPFFRVPRCFGLRIRRFPVPSSFEQALECSCSERAQTGRGVKLEKTLETHQIPKRGGIKKWPYVAAEMKQTLHFNFHP